MKRNILWAVSCLLLVGVSGAAPAQEKCDGLHFSTEEDFVANGPQLPGGSVVISDGDLLSYKPGSGTKLCARNAELLKVFGIPVDLGLDAVDVAVPEAFLVAFSTELDDPEGRFSAGDLLTTNGGVLPNIALVAMATIEFRLPIRQDFGLDALHFIGERAAIRGLLAKIKETSKEAWEESPELLAKVLEELKVDIWFSTEGTGFSPDRPAFLDGDLLSALTGEIVAPNSVLLPPIVPAGIPTRGVDFGLDAATGQREPKIESIHFSTEIYHKDRLDFDDGDVLLVEKGVIIDCAELVRSLAPATRCLGLDALHFAFVEPGLKPHIQNLCGRSVSDINGGNVSVSGPGTGLIEELLAPPSLVSTLERPCGQSVPIDGYLPNPPAGVVRFRVVYREASDPVPGAAGATTTPVVQTAWRLMSWNGGLGGCVLSSAPVLSTDANGWMDASDYLQAKNGGAFTGGCVNSELRLAVWDTLSLLPGTPAGNPIGGHDREDHYVVRLEWDDGSAFHREPVEHHLQLDNTLPVIAAFPDGLQVRLPDGISSVQACGEAPEGLSNFQVWGQFADRYYSRFRLAIRGGSPPASHGYGPHTFYDPDDGTPPTKNTNPTGTIPVATTVHLRDIDMTDLGASFTDCCYLLDLHVWDRAVRHSFNGHVVNDVTGSAFSNAFVTFAASP